MKKNKLLSTSLLFLLTVISVNAQLQFEKKFNIASAQSPKGMAIAPNGDVYIADTYNHRILVYDYDGNFKFNFGSNGNQLGQLSFPTSLVIDNTSNLYVLDSYQINKFDLTGNPISKFGSIVSQDFAYDGVNSIYVSDFGCDCIKVFTKNGTLINTFGSSGIDIGQFLYPSGIAVINSHVYVHDQQQQLQQIFTLGGGYLSTIQLNPGYLIEPMPGGNFILAGYSQLHYYTSSNTLVGSFGTLGQDDGFFSAISSVKHSPFNNKLYILDSNDKKIQIFDSEPEIQVIGPNFSSITDNEFYFSNLSFGSTGAPQEFSIQNKGWLKPLILTGNPTLNITGMEASAFISDIQTLSTTIAPGGVSQFQLTFSPTKFGLNKGSIEVFSNSINGSLSFDLVGVATNPNTPSALDINDWLSTHPSVASFISWQHGNSAALTLNVDNYMVDWANWTFKQKSDLQKAFNHIYNWYYVDNTLTDLVPEIPINRNGGILNDDAFPYTEMYHNEAWQLFVNWTAHSLFLEAYSILPWSIATYDDESKKILLNSSRFMLRSDTTFLLIKQDDSSDPRKYVFGTTVMSSPIYTYKFLSELYQPGFNKKDLIEKLIEWCNRDSMSHFTGGNTNLNHEHHWQYRGGAPVKKIVEGTSIDPSIAVPGYNPFSHWTAGCHGTDGFLKNVLRSMNIPVELNYSAHNMPIFRTENVFMSHGDDPYSGWFKDSGLSAASILVPGDLFFDYFGIDILSEQNGSDYLKVSQNCGVMPRKISGSISEDGFPVANAQITFTNTQTVFEFPIQTVFNVLTDANGGYSLIIMPGKYNVTVTNAGYPTIQTQVIHNNWPTIKDFYYCPSPPADLTADDVETHQATISWALTMGTGFPQIFQYKEKLDSNWEEVELMNESSYLLSDLEPATEYEVRIGFKCEVTEPEWSLIFEFTTQCPVPANINTSDITNTSAVISWQDPYFSPGDSYTIFYRESGANTWDTDPVSGSLSGTIKGLDPDTYYEVFVQKNCLTGSSLTSDNPENFLTQCKDDFPAGISNDYFIQEFRSYVKELFLNLPPYNILTNPSITNPYYSDYTSLEAFDNMLCIVPGKEYFVNVNIKASGSTAFVKVMLDYDQNGYFGEDEIVVPIMSISTNQGVDLPSFYACHPEMTVAKTTLRIIAQQNESLFYSCTLNGPGEVEDYSVSLETIYPIDEDKIPKWEDKKVLIFPNPVRDSRFTWSVSDTEPMPYELSLLDISNQPLFVESGIGITGEVNVASLRPGIYVLVISFADGFIASEQIIKE